MVQPAWPEDTIRSLQLSEFDERFRRYRLSPPEAEREIVDSLRRYGQIAPVVVCLCDGEYLLIDGFKRLAAARSIKGFDTLRARAMACDERAAKAAMYNLNRVGRGVQEIEEAWIVQALVREDGLSQVETAELLSHHKSWVCQRLALLERLCPEAREDLSLGLLSPTQARQLVRLPVGNQVEALVVARRESLSSQELRDVIELLLSSGRPEKKAFVPNQGSLEDFDWSFNAAAIDRTQIEQLATGEWVSRVENLVMLGQSGVGKSRLLEGIGRRLCALGKRVRYTTSGDLIAQLTASLADGTLSQQLSYWTHFDLLIIGEFGLDYVERKLDHRAGHLLFKVIAARNGKSSTAMGTNIEFDAWAAYLGDAPLAMALLDRVVDRAVLLKIVGKSYRAARAIPAKATTSPQSTR